MNNSVVIMSLLKKLFRRNVDVFDGFVLLRFMVSVFVFVEVVDELNCIDCVV